MCDPITGAAMALSMGQSVLQQQSVAQSLEGQAQSVNEQLRRSYVEAEYDYSQNAKAANEAGYEAEITKREAEARAKVRGAALGIRGTTAREIVADEARVGNYNVASAVAERRNADAARLIGTHHSYATADDQVQSINASAPTAFESITSIAAAGLSGYMTGDRINTFRNSDRVPTGLQG